MRSVPADRFVVVVKLLLGAVGAERVGTPVLEAEPPPPQALSAPAISRRKVVDQRPAQRMTGEGRPLELERVQNVSEMLDERVYSVFLGRNRLVRQPMTFEIDGDHPEPTLSESGHVAPEYINRAAPTVNEHDGRRLRIATLHHSHFQT